MPRTTKIKQPEKAVLLQIEDTSHNEENNGTNLFKILHKTMKICNKKRIDIKKLQFLQDKFTILQSVKSLELLKDEQNCRRSRGTDKNLLKDRMKAELMHMLYEECNKKKDNAIDLCFFAAAIGNEDVLREKISKCKKLINITRYCDSILVFALRHGNISSQNFFDCVDILIEAGVDINKPDFIGKTAIEHVLVLHKRSKDGDTKRKLERLVDQLKENGVVWQFVSDETIDSIKKFTTVEMLDQELSYTNKINQLFFWIGQQNIRKFTDFQDIVQFVNCDNGELKLLQYICKKCDSCKFCSNCKKFGTCNRSKRMHSAVKHLLDCGADPNGVTQQYPYHPLELAARRHQGDIVQELLENKNLQITLEMFNHFVLWRAKSVRAKHFEMFLESKKLDPTFTCERFGNTPLHYAVRFSHEKALKSILKRSENLLLVPNKAGKSALDMISPSNLKSHFDDCVALDNHNDLGSDDYKMLLRFKSLMSRHGSQIDEVRTIFKISRNKKLQHLLIHPLVHTFIELKWSKVYFYYWLLVLLQLFLFVCLGVCVYHLSDFSFYNLAFYIIFFLLNFVIKIPFIVASHSCGRRRGLTMFEVMEVILVVTLFLAFFRIEFQAFAFVEMSVVFLLTAGFHPNIAKWSVMLRRVFKTFTLLMLFFSIILLAFAVAFHILFQREFFETFWKSFFVTYVMVTGEFNLNENFSFSLIGGYVLFFFFAIYVALVMVNFWTGVAVSDISIVEKDARINGLKNVITFLDFIERRFWNRRFVKMLHLKNPKLFSDGKEDYTIDFYINRERQFGDREDLPYGVGSECFEKIRLICWGEADVLERLEVQEKVLDKIREQQEKMMDVIKEFLEKKLDSVEKSVAEK